MCAAFDLPQGADVNASHVSELPLSHACDHRK